MEKGEQRGERGQTSLRIALVSSPALQLGTAVVEDLSSVLLETKSYCGDWKQTLQCMFDYKRRKSQSNLFLELLEVVGDRVAELTIKSVRN